MSQAVKYANAYLTDRLYGGPEEGGWWYDTGEPVMSLPFLCDEKEVTDELGDTRYFWDRDARDTAYEMLYKLCEAAGLNPPEHEYFKVRDWSIDGFAFYIEEKPGEFFPQERPYYE